ncbi:hypothetical protein PGTUg99_000395 [Puccinia graminis f. sp. tritici]|uniref:Uncharacterized protein n=1 Tax=Puccinia graminis f. sp. tritici TaxID=56615 RepID=A0A5B0M283_PUCGR|nr:hypothetical protein PGTUg99_000395 [Puccinia graminis f. sp. tritici]
MCCSICNSDPTGPMSSGLQGSDSMAPEPKDPWPRGKTPRPTQPRKLHRFQFCPKLGPLNQYSTQNNHRGATTLNHTSNHTSTQPIHNRTHFLPGQSTYVQKLQVQKQPTSDPTQEVLIKGQDTTPITLTGDIHRQYIKRSISNPFSARSLIDCFYVSATKADKFTLNSVINTQLSEFDRLSLLFRDQNQQPLKARNSRLSSPFHDLSQHPFKVLFSRSVSHTFLNIPLVEGYEFNPSSCQILIGGLFCFRDRLRAFQGKSLPVPLTYYWINHRTSIVSFARSPLISSSSRFHHHSRYHDPPFNLCISNHLYIGFHDPRARDLSAQVFSIPTSALLVPQSNRLNFGFRDQVRRLLQTAPLIWQSTLV